MYAIIAPDRIADMQNAARHSATTGTLAMRLRDRLMAPLKRRADREMAELVEQIGHPGLVEDFRQACRHR